MTRLHGPSHISLRHNEFGGVIVENVLAIGMGPSHFFMLPCAEV